MVDQPRSHRRTSAPHAYLLPAAPNRDLGYEFQTTRSSTDLIYVDCASQWSKPSLSILSGNRLQ